MSIDLSNIGVLYNETHDKSLKLVHRIVNILEKKAVKIELKGINPLLEACFLGFKEEKDLNIIVGGDGTLLYAARCFAEQNAPLLGVNSGNLGFLSQLSNDNLEQKFATLFSGDFRIEERIMLRAVDRLENPTKEFYALNDIVIKRGSLSRPIILNIYIDDFKVNDFLGDGLIVSTPTGSTAYNLSAGGPIIVPEMKALVMTPICSLSLAVRPLVIPDTKLIKIVIVNEPRKIYVNADNQENTELSKGGEMFVMKSPCTTKLVLLGKNQDSFFDVLRSKLHWGIVPGESPTKAIEDYQDII